MCNCSHRLCGCVIHNWLVSNSFRQKESALSDVVYPFIHLSYFLKSIAHKSQYSRSWFECVPMCLWIWKCDRINENFSHIHEQIITMMKTSNEHSKEILNIELLKQQQSIWWRIPIMLLTQRVHEIKHTEKKFGIKRNNNNTNIMNCT